MEKIKEYLLEGTLFAIIVQSLIVGPNLPGALIAIGLLGSMGFKSFLAKEKSMKIEKMEVSFEKMSVETDTRMKEVENKIDLLLVKNQIQDVRKTFGGR